VTRINPETNGHAFNTNYSTGKQAVLVLSCDNLHMTEDVMIDPGLVMIFAHGIE